MKPRIYLAARYSRRLELCGYRKSLEAAGFTVTSRWLNGEHQIDERGNPIGADAERLVEEYEGPGAVLRRAFAKEDYADVLACEICIAFTEQPRATVSRGGRHVELGVALGARRRVWVVGPRENIFCWLEDVLCFPTWPEALESLLMEGVS